MTFNCKFFLFKQSKNRAIHLSKFFANLCITTSLGLIILQVNFKIRVELSLSEKIGKKSDFKSSVERYLFKLMVNVEQNQLIGNGQSVSKL